MTQSPSTMSFLRQSESNRKKRLSFHTNHTNGSTNNSANGHGHGHARGHSRGHGHVNTPTTTSPFPLPSPSLSSLSQKHYQQQQQMSSSPFQSPLATYGSASSVRRSSMNNNSNRNSTNSKPNKTLFSPPSASVPSPSPHNNQPMNSNTNTNTKHKNKNKSKTKVFITKETMEAIQNVLQPEYPTSLYNMAETIQHCSQVNYFHSNPIMTTNINNTNTTNANTNVHPNDDTIMKQHNEMQMKQSMKVLMEYVGSFQIKVHNWEDAIHYLNQVFVILYSNDDQDNDNNNNNNNDDDDDDIHNDIHNDNKTKNVYTNSSDQYNRNNNKNKRKGRNQKRKSPIKKPNHQKRRLFMTHMMKGRHGMSNGNSKHNSHGYSNGHGNGNGNRNGNGNSSVQAYLRKIREAQLNKKITWTRSLFPSKWKFMQELQTSKPMHLYTKRTNRKEDDDVDEGNDDDNDDDDETKHDLNEIQRGQKGEKTTTAAATINIAMEKTTSQPTPTRTKTLKTSISELSITQEIENLFRIRTTRVEREIRAKERIQSIRIEKEIKERERKEQEERERKEKEAKEAASKLLRPLTNQEQCIVQDAVYGYGGSDNDILAQGDNDSVLRKSMRTLKQRCWLNDEVIHYFYLMLSRRDEQRCMDKKDDGGVRRRSHFFKSFFLTKLFDEGGSEVYRYANVKRWSKRVPGKDIFQLEKIFFPCNIRNTHWCCAVIFVQEKRIQFYDSMHGHGMHYLEGLMQYLKDEWKAKKGGELPDADKWTLVPCEADVPQQENGYDCGVFTCMFADFISLDRPLAFSQEHITQCRERIALSIMKGVAIE